MKASAKDVAKDTCRSLVKVQQKVPEGLDVGRLLRQKTDMDICESRYRVTAHM